MVDMLGDEDSAADYLSKCIFIVGMGSNDYLNNYFMPTVYSSNCQYTPQQYADVLIQQYSQQLRGHGMTEAGPVLSMCLAFAKEPFEVKSGSCGTVVRNAELKIVDPDIGKSLPRNQRGEICIRGAQIMKGYLNDPKATENTIDQNGCLHTGDIGIVDDDDEIFIVDRLKELIKYKGFQVAPAELEAMLLTHPEIKDDAVVLMKDELAGEIPVAFVVRSNGSESTEDEKDVR